MTGPISPMRSLATGCSPGEGRPPAARKRYPSSLVNRCKSGRGPGIHLCVQSDRARRILSHFPTIYATIARG